MSVTGIGRLPIEIAHAIQSIVDTYSEILLPIVFLGFFGFGAIAIWYKGRTRRTFIAITLSFLLVSSILALSVYPFIHMQRYSTPGDQAGGGHEIKMVDGSNQEIWLDPAAVAPMDSRLSHFAERMATEMNEESLVNDANLLLEHSAEYRTTASRDRPDLSYPTAGVRDHWNGSLLGKYSEFEAVRIYETEYEYEPGSYLERTESERCVVEVVPETETVREGC